jgi:hypothetical protein
MPWLRTDAPPAAPDGDGHEYGPGDRLALGRAVGREPAEARPLGPAGTPSVITPDGALLADDLPTRVTTSFTLVGSELDLAQDKLVRAALLASIMS